MSSVTAKWVQALEGLTGIRTLRFLTMLTWRSVLCVKGLLRLKKAWCPRCYEESKQANRIIYDPLLWALTDVNICLRHHQRLITTCPHCQKASPVLHRVALPGYCPFCQQWLGESLHRGSDQFSEDESETFQQDLWRAQQVGTLVATAPCLPFPPAREQIAAIIHYCAERHRHEKIQTLADMMGLHSVQVTNFLSQKDVPHIKTLLDLCSGLDIPLLQLLTVPPSQSAPSTADLLNLLTPLAHQSWDRFTKEDIAHLKRSLNDVLSKESAPLPPLKQIAEQLGVSVRALRKYCPEQCRAITGTLQCWDSDEMTLYLQQGLEEALTSEEPISLESITHQLDCSRAVLYRHFPDLCEAILIKYRNKYSRTAIKRCLQEALTSTGPISSVRELALEKGWNPDYVKKLFPDLCREITTRHRAEHQEIEENKREGYRMAIHSIVEDLHLRGIYPSAVKICRKLGKPCLLMQKDLQGIWKAALETLGYTARER